MGENMSRSPFALRSVLLRAAFVASLVVLFVMPRSVTAQTASLRGAVVDPSGASIPGASVTATLIARNAAFETETTADGQYLLPTLPIGVYALRVETAGFKVYSQSGIELTVDSRRLVNVRLELGQVSEEVTVTGDAVRVDAVTPTLQQLVDSKRVTELPLNGRNVYELSSLVPGALPGSAGGSGGSMGLHLNGGRSGGEGGTTVNVRLDGALNIDQNFNTVLPSPPPDAVQEFNIQTSIPSAKYNYSAGVIEIATKSGTNDLHGSLYEFFRNDALDARNFFAADVTKRKRNQFGAAIGGPVILPGYNGRDQTFWFFNWEEQREPRGAVSTIFVPTAAQRQGNFSGFRTAIRDPETGDAFPNNVVPADRLSAVASNLSQEFVPLPQDDSGRYTFDRPDDNSPRQIMARGDHHTQRDVLTGRSYWTRQTSPSAYGSLPFFSSAGQDLLKTDNHTFSWTRTASPTVVNVARLSYNRWRSGRDSDLKVGTADRLQQLGWSESYANGVQAASQGFFPRLLVSGFFDVSTVLPFIVRGSDTITFENDMSWHKGKHNIQLGGRLMKAYQDDGDIIVRGMGSYSFNGQFSGSGLSDFMLGRPSFFEQQNEQTASVRHTYLGFYVQDDIQASSRLSLSLGLRYDLPLAPVERDGKAMTFLPGSQQQSSVFPNAPAGLLFVGDSGVSEGGRRTDKGDFGPRFGLVYSLTSDQKTVVRAGYGLLYNPQWTNLTAQFDNKQPWVNRIQLSAPPSIADPWADFPGGNPFPSAPGDQSFQFQNATIFSFDPDYQDPYVQQWNLNIQRELWSDLLVTAAYVGTKGTHLSLVTDINPATYIPGDDPVTGQPLSTLANLNERRPYYAPLTRAVWYLPGGNSAYHAFQLSLDKRFSKGFSVLTSYTFGKSIDVISNNFSTNGLLPQDPNNFAGERSLSSYDRTHSSVTSWVWEIPYSSNWNSIAKGILGGWQFNGVVSLVSGQPIGVSSSTDNALRGFANRPNRLRSPDLDSGRPKGERLLEWFDTSAYSANGIGEFGTAPRTDGQARGPGLANANLGILKDFRITERQRLQFRAELFNAFNRASFGNPQGNFNSSAFGRITSASDPRIVQFALKYLF